MKFKKFALFILTVLCVLVLVGCDKDVPVESVTIEGGTSVLVSGTLQLTAEVLPEDATDKEVEWSSSNKSVATVSNSGLVTAVSAGNVTITAKAGGKSDTHDIAVQAQAVPVESVTISGKNEVAVQATITLVAQVLPENATNKAVVWSSSDENIATVENGAVTGKAVGNVTITATADGKSDTLEIAVKSELPVEVAKTSVVLYHNSKLKVDGKTHEIDVVSGHANVEYLSSNEAVATVDEQGKVTAVAEGEAVITVRSKLNENNKVEIEVSVGAVVAAGGEAGRIYNYKYEDLETRSTILAALERWLINAGYTIPLFSISNGTLYSDRVTLLSETYVPNMGFGAIYGGVKTGRATGTAQDPAYRAYTTAGPTTLNMFMYTSNSESDVLGYLLDSPYTIDFTEEVDGFTIYPSMASKLAEPVQLNNDDEWEVIPNYDEDTLSKAWKVTLRNDLEFTDYKGDLVRAINVDDFIYSYQQLLDPDQANTRADDVFFITGYEVVGARAYFKDQGQWDQVGIYKIDDYSFVIELLEELGKFDFHYNNSSFLNGPVYEPLYESLKTTSSEGVVTSTYGSVTENTSNSQFDTMMFTGPYVLEYFEEDKEIRYKKNPNFSQNSEIPFDYQMDNIKISIVADSNAAYALWEAGDLDVITIPSERLADHIDDPALKKSPGATIWKFNFNALSQEGLYDTFGLTAEEWEVNPLLQVKDFRNALFYAVDRNKIASQVFMRAVPDFAFWSSAYCIMDGMTATEYRSTAAGLSVVDGIYSDDLDLMSDSGGYSPTYAKELYTSALTKLVTDGVINQGTEAEPTVIELDLQMMDSLGQTSTDLVNFLEDDWEKIFNSQTVYPYIQLDVTTGLQSNIYDDLADKGNWDLFFGAVGGGELDPIGGVWVYYDGASDDSFSNTLQMTYGIDTNAVEIEWNGLLWSYESLGQAANGNTLLVEGDLGPAELSQIFDTLQSDGLKVIKAVAAELDKSDDPAVAAAEAALMAAVTLQEAYDALNTGLTELAEGSDLDVLAFVKTLVKGYVDEYADYVKVLLKDDYDYIGDLIEAEGRENVPEDYLEFYDTTYPQNINTDIPADIANFKGQIDEKEAVQAIIELYASAKTKLYEYYLW